MTRKLLNSRVVQPRMANGKFDGQQRTEEPRGLARSGAYVVEFTIPRGGKSGCR